MNVGIGYSENKEAWSAGRHVAETAMRSAGIERADLVHYFCRMPAFC
jgi:hypothetical protein